MSKRKAKEKNDFFRNVFSAKSDLSVSGINTEQLTLTKFDIFMKTIIFIVPIRGHHKVAMTKWTATSAIIEKKLSKHE